MRYPDGGGLTAAERARREPARLAAADLRRIRGHAVRHTTASLLKDLGVPARDAQIILGHAHVITTQQTYTHVDEAARRDALTRLNELLGGSR